MKNLKKVLALVLAFACAFTMFASAANFTDQADITCVDAVNMLTSLGVIDGYTDGSFQPEGTVTRSEMAKMIFVVRNNRADDTAYKNIETTFTDLGDAEWAQGYIKFCQSQGIIAGKSTTQFDPNSDVTGLEAAKMLLVVAGYDADKAGLTGANWKTNTLKWAGQANLLEDVTASLEEGLPRQYAAQMIYNALETTRVKWSDDSNSFDDILSGGVKETVGRAYMGLYRTAGILVAVSGNEIKVANVDKAESDSTGYDSSGDPDYETNFTKLDTDYSDLLGQKVKVLFKDGKANSVLGVYPMSDNSSVTVYASEIEADDEKVKFGGTSYRVATEDYENCIDVYFTSVTGTTYENQDFTTEAGVKYDISAARNTASSGRKFFDNWDTSAAVMTFVDSNGNGKFNAVIVTDYKAAEVTSVSSSKLVAGKSYNFSDENIDEGFSKEDWAIISWDRYNDCQRIQRADVVAETLNGLKKNSTSENYGMGTGYGVQYHEYQLGDSWYNASTATGSDINTVQAGDSVTAVIVNGIVCKIKRVSDGSLSDVPDIALVVSKDSGISGDQVKLQFFNDTTRVVDVDSDSTIKYVNLEIGQLYEYSVSGGEYSFEEVVDEDDYYGEYTYKGNETYTIQDGSIGGMTIDDKARVILWKQISEGDRDYDKDGVYTSTWATGDSDVITGKQLKTLEASKVLNSSATTLQAAWFSADVSGLTRAAAIAVTVEKLPTGLTSNDYYGFIMSDASESASNEVQYNLLIQGSDEVVHVYEKNAKTSERKKRQLIGYKSLDDEDSDKRYIEDVKLYTITTQTNEDGTVDLVGSDTFGLSAITSTNSAKTKIQIANLTHSDGSDFEVNSDTVLFFVDTDDMTGVSTDSASAIQKADKWYDDADGAKIIDESDGTAYVANCVYLTDGTDELDVLVVETGDGNFRGPYRDAMEKFRTAGGQADNLEDIQSIFKDASTATLVGTLESGDAVTVSNGKTLNISSKATVDAGVKITIEKGGTLKTAHGEVISNSSSATLQVDDTVIATSTASGMSLSANDGSTTLTVNTAVGESTANGISITNFLDTDGKTLSALAADTVYTWTTSNSRWTEKAVEVKTIDGDDVSLDGTIPTVDETVEDLLTTTYSVTSNNSNTTVDISPETLSTVGTSATFIVTVSPASSSYVLGSIPEAADIGLTSDWSGSKKSGNWVYTLTIKNLKGSISAVTVDASAVTAGEDGVPSGDIKVTTDGVSIDTSTVTWTMGSDGNYTADLTLSADSGYAFETIAANTEVTVTNATENSLGITGAVKTAVEAGGTSMTVTLTYTPAAEAEAEPAVAEASADVEEVVPEAEVEAEEIPAE